MRPEINKEINDFVEEKKILSAYFMRAQIKVALAELEYDTEISEPRLLQAAHQFTKDIAKIKIYQNNNVLITKYVGYLAFWIRKTHPLGIVTLKAPAGAKEPAPATANSILSIYTIKNMLLDLSNAKDIEPKQWPAHAQGILSSNPGKFRESLTAAFQDYMIAKLNIDYIAHSLSVRTFGPHHMTMIADLLLYLACQPSQQGGPSVTVFRNGGEIVKGRLKRKG